MKIKLSLAMVSAGDVRNLEDSPPSGMKIKTPGVQFDRRSTVKQRDIKAPPAPFASVTRDTARAL
jgi:hypothetical protein